MADNQSETPSAYIGNQDAFAFFERSFDDISTQLEQGTENPIVIFTDVGLLQRAGIFAIWRHYIEYALLPLTRYDNLGLLQVLTSLRCRLDKYITLEVNTANNVVTVKPVPFLVRSPTMQTVAGPPTEGTGSDVLPDQATSKYRNNTTSHNTSFLTVLSSEKNQDSSPGQRFHHLSHRVALQGSPRVSWYPQQRHL